VEVDVMGGSALIRPDGPSLFVIRTDLRCQPNGIDPDLRIHISDSLLSMNDGPMFEQGIKASVGRTLRLPARKIDWPDRDRLAQRFEQFRAN
jgi:hypothetical protein